MKREKRQPRFAWSAIVIRVEMGLVKLAQDEFQRWVDIVNEIGDEHDAADAEGHGAQADGT